jgi:hypothetical protein
MGIYPLAGEGEETGVRLAVTRVRWGIIAYLVATPIVWLIGCNPLDITHACTRATSGVATFVAGMIEIMLLVMMFAGRRMWRFTMGFFIAYLVSATFTRGTATVLWTAPANVAIEFAKPLRGPAVEHHEASAAKSEWVAIKRTQHPTIVHGARLVNLVHDCARRAMLADSINSYPRSVAELTSQDGCEALRATMSNADSAPARYSESDNGWRWRYDAGPQDPYGRVMAYTVRVGEDSAINRPNGPEFSSDEKGAIVELTSGSNRRFAASPVASLVMLRKCLARVPAANAALRAKSPWLGNSSAMNSVGSVCPELARHIAGDYPDHDDNRGRLAVPAHEQAGEFTDTVAVYVTRFVPADVDGTIFELLALPGRVQNGAIRAGSRQFLVARYGTIHTSVGERPPTENDPIAAECLPGGGVDCGAAEAPPPASRP